jgi:peptidyl-dipeptidase Dcp
MKRRTFLKSAAAVAALGTSSLVSFDLAAAKTAALGPMLAPWTGDHGGYPPFDKVTVPGFKPAILAGMDLARVEIKKIAGNRSKPTFENTLATFEDSGRPLTRVQRLFGIWTSTLNDPEMQKVEEEMSPVFAAFGDEIVQNEALFKRIKALNDGMANANLDAQQKRLTDVQYTYFVRQGAGLDETKKARLRQINEKLASLFTKFRQNQLYDEGTYAVVLEHEADLAGLPESLRQAAAENAKHKNMPGKWVILNTRSSAEPFLTFSSRRDLREKVFKMWNSRGRADEAHANKPIIKDVLKLRAERALLLGYPTHAHWILDDNMAKTPDNAMALMTRVWKASTARVREDVAEMQKIANKEKAKIKIEAWDYRYYAEKLRLAKYDIDQNEVKQYLQLDKIREGMFWAAGQVYGVQFAKLEGLPIAHPDVTVYEVTRGGKRVGLWYFDPYAREGKNSGAWMNEYRTQERFRGEVTPIVSNNSNFVKGAPGEPILISWDDARTMFHEFGHALHGLQSNVTYPTLAGTNVKRDFVEFPSQVNERWLATPEVLNKFALHYKTGKPIPKALVDKIVISKTFNQGFITTEYLANAIYDMKLHLAATPDKDIDANEFEAALFAEIGMPKEIVLRHPATAFGHIFADDGYSAGYYVYIWADTMSADASEAFIEAGGFYDRATCDRFRDTIFSVGNSVAPDVAFRNFRGRDVDTNALMRDRGFPVV